MIIAEVILPIPVKSNFTYATQESQEEQLAVGKRVLVSFGKKKIYTGVIRSLKEENEFEKIQNLKFIDEILDDEPVLYEPQFQLFEWTAFYYACTEGEVLQAALPAGLKLESSLRIEMHPGLPWEDLNADDKEYMLLEALSIQPTLNFQEAAKIWNITNPSPRLKTMAARGWIRMFQEVEEKYKPKLKTFLRLDEAFTTEEALQEAFEMVKRAKNQEALLMRVVMAFYKDQALPQTETLKELNISSSVANALVKKGILVKDDVQVDRLELYGYKQKEKILQLTDEQERALGEIRHYVDAPKRKPILLHGITGSGKTQVYLELMKDVLAEGKQVLYLLPEITLTKQIIDRIKSELGEKVGIYHSRFNDQERVEIWRKVLKRQYNVVIGVRSSIFLPFENLGLIVVDEEHDQSFKQTERAPRYNARDLAVYYAHLSNCPLILGSATPAFETYQNALKGKYHLVEMKKRATKAQLPEVEIVDMRIQRKKKLNKGILSRPLYQQLSGILAKGEQAILFQNRRGYSPYLICENCGSVPQCINCDISLTYHKEHDHLRCHYCGHTEFSTQQCSHCESYEMKNQGIGTEKIAEEIAELFPNQKVERMDFDTTRGKMAFHNLITRFENRQIDILVGTKMVSKGLDFENVTLVGVINADNLLTFPDFRAYENAYQLLTQVSGRAGRSEKLGKVIVQTMMPDNVVLRSIQEPFPAFFEQEMIGREQLGYPPSSRLIRIEMRDKKQRYLEGEALRLESMLKPIFGVNLLGPDYPLIARVRNLYRMQFLIKLHKNASPKKVRKLLKTEIGNYYKEAPNKRMRIVVDVDPL